MGVGEARRRHRLQPSTKIAVSPSPHLDAYFQDTTPQAVSPQPQPKKGIFPTPFFYKGFMAGLSPPRIKSTAIV
ncbi:hypothetical protein [Nostoc sp. T09]|uniref:hypothetical protein n=1 Tax=Nostoc sp. T09 TaxID=1932621 RepID=UPI00117F09DC|nr:hypothetical protein [Nostoc sp. T09]